MPPGESCPHAWRVRLLVSSLTPHLHHGRRQRGLVRPYIRLWGLFVVCPYGTRRTHADLPTLRRRLPLDGGGILALLTEVAGERPRRGGSLRLMSTHGVRKDPDHPLGPLAALGGIRHIARAYHRGPRRGPPRCWPSRSSRGRASLIVSGRPPRLAPLSSVIASREDRNGSREDLPLPTHAPGRETARHDTRCEACTEPHCITDFLTFPHNPSARGMCATSPQKAQHKEGGTAQSVHASGGAGA